MRPMRWKVPGVGVHSPKSQPELCSPQSLSSPKLPFLLRVIFRDFLVSTPVRPLIGRIESEGWWGDIGAPEAVKRVEPGSSGSYVSDFLRLPVCQVLPWGPQGSQAWLGE